MRRWIEAGQNALQVADQRTPNMCIHNCPSSNQFVVVETARNSADSENEVVVAVEQAEACMPNRQSLGDDPVLSSSEGRATARVAAIGGSRLIGCCRLELVQSPLRPGLQMIRGKLGIQGRRWWQSHFVHFLRFVN